MTGQMLALDGAGNVYVTSDMLDRIAPDGGLTNLTSLSSAPTGMAVTAAGSVFYTAAGRQRSQRMLSAK